MRTQLRNSKPPNFRVGDKVKFQFGVGIVNATILEDRGEIGVGGRRLYRVFVPRDPDPMEFEVPGEVLQPASAG